ncbi:amidohydrolase/deacetylase family metallohydrolase [Alphaproteobacteria bacterium]|nr:amidohydrolase/deacetylase family metallohydrolase [Alphaproteobacteria bacterium]
MGLILKGGRIIDPASGTDAVLDIGFEDGRVAAIAPSLASEDAMIKDVSGKIVTPGLVDMHTHVYWGGTSLSIDAEDFCRKSAVTTCVDTGSAGPGNFAGFRKHVIEESLVRIVPYLHVSFAGIFGFSKTIMVGESEDIRLMAPRDAVRVVQENRDIIAGIKVRLGRHASGIHGMTPMTYALQVAEEVDLPMMVHIDEPPPSYEAVLEVMRPGDVLTHAFRPFPNSPINRVGEVKDEVLAARERGVLFDIGHGMGSFGFETAKAMLDNGFMPDTISSDIHELCIDGPAYDQVTTLSKFLCLGMDLNDVIAASTVNAGKALQMPELGVLEVGGIGDASILSIEEDEFPYEDVLGEILVGDKRIAAKGAVVNGEWWDCDESD